MTLRAGAGVGRQTRRWRAVSVAPIVPGATLSIGWGKRDPFTVESSTTKAAGPLESSEGFIAVWVRRRNPPSASTTPRGATSTMPAKVPCSCSRRGSRTFQKPVMTCPAGFIGARNTSTAPRALAGSMATVLSPQRPAKSVGAPFNATSVEKVARPIGPRGVKSCQATSPCPPKESSGVASKLSRLSGMVWK